MIWGTFRQMGHKKYVPQEDDIESFTKATGTF